MGFIRLIIDLYILLIIVDTIMSYLPQYRNQAWVSNIKKGADLTLKPVRKYMPPDLPFDFSPLAVIILLKLFVAIF